MNSKFLDLKYAANLRLLSAGRKQWRRILTLAILIPVAVHAEAPGRTRKQYNIEFTKIVDSTQGFTSFNEFPAINNRAEVAFMAVQNGYSSGEGVFRVQVDRDVVTTVASVAEGLNNFDNVAINAGGVVAFAATTSTGSRAIFTGNGVSKTLIADSTANRLAKIGVGAPAINAFGTVAFFSLRLEPGLPSSIFTGQGGPLTTVAATSRTTFERFGNAAINDSGTVVFSATRVDRTAGLFTVRGNLVNIVDANTHPEFDNFGDAVINNAGTVADTAFFFNPGAEIISGNARGITPRTDPADPTPLTNAEHPSINNHGAVAFNALLNFPGENGLEGIFLEVSGGHSLIPIIKPGDRLFGSTVSRVNLGRFALNDRFQMAISYSLVDGRSGVALATFDGEREGDGQ